MLETESEIISTVISEKTAWLHNPQTHVSHANMENDKTAIVSLPETGRLKRFFYHWQNDNLKKFKCAKKAFSLLKKNSSVVCKKMVLAAPAY